MLAKKFLFPIIAFVILGSGVGIGILINSSSNVNQEEYDALLSDFQELNATYNLLLGYYTDLQDSYDELQQSYNYLQNQYEMLSEANFSLTEILSSLQSDYDQLSLDYEQLLLDYSYLNDTYYTLLVEYNSLEIENEDLYIMINMLNQTYLTLLDNYDALEQEYSFLLEQYEAILSGYELAEGDTYIDHEPIIITSEEDFVNYNFTGAGTELDPYKIENLNITSTSSIDYGIKISGTYAYFVIQNCYIKDAITAGIYFYEVSWNTGTIFNNTLSDSYIYIHLDSKMTVIANNTLTGKGIKVSSDGCAVVNNSIILNGGNGIYSNDGFFGSDYVTITNNFIRGADKSINGGLGSFCTISSNYLINNVIGIYGYEDSTISNNTLDHNEVGIDLGNDNLVRYNLIKNTLSYGILYNGIYGGNIIHHNVFINNNLLVGGSQVCDDLDYFDYCNVWYDELTLEGNHWSDWSGIGNYSIAGDASSYDPYPQPYFIIYNSWT